MLKEMDRILIYFYYLASDRRLEDDHAVQGTHVCYLEWDQLNFIVIPYKIKFIRFFFFFQLKKPILSVSKQMTDF